MDKQKAKRAAALSAAAAVGSVGGSFGSDVIIDKKTTNNDSPVEESVVEVVNEDNVQEHISSFGANDNTEVVEHEAIIVDPVEPEEIIFIDYPLGPIQEDVLMYGGPGMCENIIYPDSDMYGGPIDDLYDIE